MSRNFILVFSKILILLLFLWTVYVIAPSLVEAQCCGSGDCSTSQSCVNIPNPCPGPSNNQGVCVNKSETCSVNNPCTGSECCVSSGNGSAPLCYPQGSPNCGGGGGGNYSPTDYCGKIGMVTVCGPLGGPIDVTWGCAKNLWDCRVRQPGALIGQGWCDGDPKNPIDCQKNCWCESLNPKGNFDSASCTLATGWACDSSQWNVSLFVNFYSDAGLTNYIGSTYANQNRPDVASSCGGEALHGFNYAMPQVFNDGVAHNIYAVAQNIGTGSNTTLGGSPKVITCAPPPPPTSVAWWQVKDGDVSTNGDLRSSIPGANLFDLIGSGGYAGVPAYGAGTNLTSTNVSTNKWLVNSTTTNAKVFDYAYFANQIPSDTLIHSLPSNVISQADIDANTTPSYGYYWYKFDGSGSGLDLSLNSNLNIGTKKVVLLVNSANFNIGGKINLTAGQGFFMTTVGKTTGGAKGNISVSPTVGGVGTPTLEGIYEADNQFSTGTGGAKNDPQLYVRGSVVAYGTTNLQRDIGGAPSTTSPSELFEYAPDQIMLFPSKLGYRKINWKEVAP